jgi:hypothetical protein
MNYLKFLLITNLLISITYSLNSQISLTKTRDFNSEKPFDFVEIDNQGYLYLVHDDQIVKLNEFGEELYRYSNKSLGEIEGLDVSNSLRPIIFYKDQALIVLLDNTLSQQEDIINLSSLSLDQTNCISNSNFDNGIWFYDIALNEIIKLNSNSQFQFKSGNLSAILSNINLPIVSLEENNGNLYAQTSSEILVFDQYGSLLHNLNISTNSKPIFKKNSILFIEDNLLNVFDMLDFSVSKSEIMFPYDYIIGGGTILVGIKGNAIDLLELK